MKKRRAIKMTGPSAFCWHCREKTNYVLDDGTDEIWCCTSCLLKHYKIKKGKCTKKQ